MRIEGRQDLIDRVLEQRGNLNSLLKDRGFKPIEILSAQRMIEAIKGDVQDATLVSEQQPEPRIFDREDWGKIIQKGR